MIIDGAHNPQGVSALVSSLNDEKISKVDAVFGVCDDKEWQKMLSIISPNVATWHLPTFDSVRAVDPERIQLELSRSGINARRFDGKVTSVLDTLRQCNSSRPILIFGSLYLVAESRKALGIKRRMIWEKHPNGSSDL